MTAIRNIGLSSMPLVSMGICFTKHISEAAISSFGNYKTFCNTDIMDIGKKYLTCYTNVVHLEPQLESQCLVKSLTAVEPTADLQETRAGSYYNTYYEVF
jgi:hypothetical protein